MVQVVFYYVMYMRYPKGKKWWGYAQEEGVFSLYRIGNLG